MAQAKLIHGKASHRERETKLSEARTLFEPMQAILNQSDNMVRDTMAKLLAHNNEIRSEIIRRM